MAQFASDSFTDASDTLLTAHTSNSGHSWAYSGSGGAVSGSQPTKIVGNQLREQIASGDHYIYYSSATPASAEYSVSLTITWNGQNPDLTGPCLGVAPTSTPASSYAYAFHIAPQVGFARLRRHDGGAPVNLASVPGTLVSGVAYRMTIARGAAGAITGKVQRLSDSQWLNASGAWQSTEVACASVTDTTYTAAGHPGITTYANSTSYALMDDFSADESGGGTAPSITTQPGNASVTAGATATFTAAASGSPAPTFQWQRNPGGVGTWADIVAATGASYTTPATTVTGGSANNGDTYRVVATNASGSATSTAATLTVGASNAAPTFPGPSISNLSISQGVAMSAVNVASRFSDTDALTFSAIGTWPAGVTVSSAGVISGTPTTLGNYTALTVRATDTAAQTVDSNSFSIAVTAVADTLNFQASGMEFGARTGLGISTFALDVGSGYRYTVHADGLTLGAALYTSGVVTTDAAGKLPNLVDAAVTAGVMYRVHAIRQSDGAAATFRIAAA